jgi:outer membrane receptor for ferrienterochelin and colicin
LSIKILTDDKKNGLGFKRRGEDKMKLIQGSGLGIHARLAAGCSLAILCCSVSAEGQNLPSSARQSTDASDIPEIIVTAQRRNENLQDVPIAVSAVSAAQLEMQGITSTLDIGRAVPSLIVTQTFGYVRRRRRIRKRRCDLY